MRSFVCRLERTSKEYELYVDVLEFVFYLLFINVTVESNVVPFYFLYKDASQFFYFQHT